MSFGDGTIIGDIQREYKRYRTLGMRRAEAILEIKKRYADELEDVDERVGVFIGMALALSKKKELTVEIAHGAQREISKVLEEEDLSTRSREKLQAIQTLLLDDSLLGEEAHYRYTPPYAPDWKIGDVFAHTLTFPAAEKLGIAGWSIVFYKIGEFADYLQDRRQLMYVTLCPPGQEPTNAEELQALGFLKMMNHGTCWDYMAQMTIKSAKAEKGLGLRRLGNFPGVALPEDRTEEDPLVSMPFFGPLNKGDTRPAYEDLVCRLYRRNGAPLQGQEDGSLVSLSHL